MVKQSRRLKVMFDWMRRFPQISELCEYRDLCGHSDDDTFLKDLRDQIDRLTDRCHCFFFFCCCFLIDKPPGTANKKSYPAYSSAYIRDSVTIFENNSEFTQLHK